MTDVLGVAMQHRDELQAEIAELEDFIRTARDLMQRSTSATSRPESTAAVPPPSAGTRAESRVETSVDRPKPWLQQDARQ